MTSRLLCCVLIFCAVATGCKRKGSGNGPELDPVIQLNAGEGTLGVFTFPYYTALLALDGGGAVASWMRQDGAFRPIVFRKTPDAHTPFGEEQYLPPESQRDTISVAPQLVPGAGPGELYAMWQARRQKTGDKFIMFRRSQDAGTTWEPDRRVNTEATSFIPSVAADRRP